MFKTWDHVMVIEPEGYCVSVPASSTWANARVVEAHDCGEYTVAVAEPSYSNQRRAPEVWMWRVRESQLRKRYTE